MQDESHWIDRAQSAEARLITLKEAYEPPAPGRPEDPTPPDFPPTTEQKDDDQRRDAPPFG